MTLTPIAPQPDGAAPAGIITGRNDVLFWMSGATAIPLYHMHPHIEEECVLPDDIAEQTRRIMTTFDEVLRFNGLGWRDVIKFARFETDMRDHATIDAVIAEYFAGTGWQPASVVVGINALSAPGARLEIEVVAALPAAADDVTPVTIGPAAAAGRAPGVRVSGHSSLAFLSGVGPGGPTVPAGLGQQVKLTLDELERVLGERGLAWPAVAKILLHLTDIRDLAPVSAAIEERFGGAWRPALTVIEVDNLPVPGARLQLDAIAAE
jgi:2-iminobutanoate/2-iminopropanoate deaminase